VTKADVISEISEKTGIDKADVTATVEAFFSVENTAIVIDEHYVPSFKPSKVFVEKIKTSNKITEEV